MAALFFALTVARLRASRPGRPRSARGERRSRCRELCDRPVVVIFALVIGGIYAGIFTPTEAAAVGASASA